MKTDYFEYSISGHFVTALEYNDISGLNNDDKEALVLFLEQIENDKREEYQDREYKPAQYNMFSYGEDSHFSRDEITGLMADTIILTVTFELKELKQ